MTQTPKVAKPSDELSSKSRALDSGLTSATLAAYKETGGEIGLRKVCLEIVDLCRELYASTTSEAERAAFREVLGKVNSI